jgi:transcriptional regulator with XRE-family HTH domain
MRSKQLGEVLREQREKLRLTQPDIADRMDVTQSYISAWELGKPKRVNFAQLRKLARAYELDIDLLARVSGYALPVEQRPEPDDSQAHLAAMLPSGLNRAQMEAVAAYAEHLKRGYWLEKPERDRSTDAAPTPRN